MTVGVPDAKGIGWVTDARSDTPSTRDPRITAIRTMVIRALRASGRRKMLTPLEMASVPVRAEPPEAKALRTTKIVAP